MGQSTSAPAIESRPPSKLIKSGRVDWLPEKHRIAVVPASASRQQQYSSVFAAYGGLQRCRADAAHFLCVDKAPNAFRNIALKAISTVCTFGEIDDDNIFYPLGCATFLSGEILLTAYHVAFAVGDTSRICVRIESSFSAENGRSQCHETLVQIDVVAARILIHRDVCIMLLNKATSDVVTRIIGDTNFSKVTLDRLSAYTLLVHTDTAAEHTVVTIGEASASDIGAQIATHIISEGTFGACCAAVFNTDGCISGVYVGAELTFNGSSFTKGVMSINDLIRSEFDEYHTSTLALFLHNPLCILPEYHDWINPEARLMSYVPEGTKFNKLRLTMSFKDCVLKCVGTGGQHKDVRKYNYLDNMESDHFPPFLAYQLSTNSRYFSQPRKGKSNLRVNEMELPALLLPHAFHRPFITTNKTARAQAFAEELASLMNKNKFKDAIKRNIEEYEKAGLFTPKTFLPLDNNTGFGINISVVEATALVEKFKAGIKDALVCHQELGFISERDRLALNVYTDNCKSV